MPLQQEQQQRWAPAPPLRTAAAPRRLAAAAGGGDSTDEALSSIAGNPLFNNSQFMGVLQNSLARQGPDALTSAPPAEPREDATVEVLTSALNQSKITLQQLVMWQNQLAAQIAAQQKQVCGGGGDAGVGPA